MRFLGFLDWPAKALALALVIFGSSIGFASTASAALLFSAPGNGVCTMYGGAPCTLQGILPHPLWQANNPGGSPAVWVSYANTGDGAGSSAPAPSANYLMQVTETISASPKNAILNLKVWADDTAGVFLNGNQIFAPNFTQNICANGPIGCQPFEPGVFSIQLPAGPANTIAFQVYQPPGGGGPFGLLYAGSVTEVPEPSTIALLAMFGFSLLGFAALRRRGEG